VSPCKALALILALLLGAAACTPLPTPFAHEPEDITKTRRQMLELPDAAGIFVNPEVAGASAEQSAALTAAMVKALGDMNVPATTTSRGRHNYNLEGKLASAAGASSGKVLILWRLTTPEGQQLGEHLQHETVIPRDWQAASKALMARIATGAAKPLAALVQDKGSDAAQFAMSADVEVRPVEGAPGDGRTTLTRAIRHFLRQAKVKVAETTGTAPTIVQGVVTMGAPRGGNQSISIRWKVLRADGSEVAHADQGNFVPHGSLNGAWADTAGLIAEAATPAITEILARTALSAKAVGGPAPGAAAKPAGTP
jgi:hypothetical protein